MDINVLMVDDHPLIIDGYKSILSYNKLGYNVKTTSAYNCKEAYDIIFSTNAVPIFDIVFIDVTLPAYHEEKINSGEDLALLIKNKKPQTKVVILTSHVEILMLKRILKEINPKALLLKNDITSDEFLEAFDSVIKGSFYHSKTIKSINNDLKGSLKKLDHYNSQIILLLSQGIKSKSIQEQLNLSKSAIDKRKVAIKEYLGIDKGNDEDILREARKQGLI